MIAPALPGASAPTPSRPARPLAGGILRNVTSNWAGLLVSILLSFVLAPLTVATLGNTYYGIWTLLMQFTGYLWLFDFGVRESVVKYVAQYHASDDRESLTTTVRTAVSMYGVVSLGTLGAAGILALALPYVFNLPPDAIASARWTALFVGATVAQSFVFNVFVGVLMGLQKFYLMARIGMFFGIARAAVVYLLLINGYGIVALAFVQFAMTLASNLLVYRLCVLSLPYLSVRLVRPQRAEVIKLLNYGKYVLIANVGDKVVFATDSIVIGMFLPISSLTYYAIGGSLVEHFRSFVTSMASIINPLSSGLEARRETRALVTVALTGAKAAMILSLPVCIGFILLGERFISLWMGAEYGGPAGQVLAVLAIGHLIGAPYYTISGMLYGLGQHRIVAWSRIFDGLTNLTLSLLLVGRYGLVGVAFGTIVPHIILVGGVLPLCLPRLLPIDLREYYVSTYVRPIVAALPFAVACWFIARELMPQTLVSLFAYVAAGLLVYVVPCWLVVLSPVERDAVREALGRRLAPLRRVA